MIFHGFYCTLKIPEEKALFFRVVLQCWSRSLHAAAPPTAMARAVPPAPMVHVNEVKDDIDDCYDE